MGEQPLFSCKAHVFQLEPEMKKSWIALSTIAVNVQIFHDPIKNIYRIVSIEGTKALINSIITAKMTFTKTSQKFGQWIDFKLNLVYGLGFPNDSELNKFVDKFKEIKEFTRNGIKTHERSNSCESSSIHRNVHLNTLYNDSNNANEIQLKQENEKLKNALNQSAISSRKAEGDLNILKLSNIKLNKALQESHSNMEEWKKELQLYKNECERLQSSITNNEIIKKCVNIESRENVKDINQNPSNNSDIKAIKNDLIILSHSFDEKLQDLLQIRESMNLIINDLGNRCENI